MRATRQQRIIDLLMETVRWYAEVAPEPTDVEATGDKKGDPAWYEDRGQRAREALQEAQWLELEPVPALSQAEVIATKLRERPRLLAEVLRILGGTAPREVSVVPLSSKQRGST